MRSSHLQGKLAAPGARPRGPRAETHGRGRQRLARLLQPAAAAERVERLREEQRVAAPAACRGRAASAGQRVLVVPVAARVQAHRRVFAKAGRVALRRSRGRTEVFDFVHTWACGKQLLQTTVKTNSVKTNDSFALL